MLDKSHETAVTLNFRGLLSSGPPSPRTLASPFITLSSLTSLVSQMCFVVRFSYDIVDADLVDKCFFKKKKTAVVPFQD